jgi:hypothetical protein
VRKPFLSPEALAYAWRQLAARAGLPPGGAAPLTNGFETLQLPVYYSSPESVPGRSSALIVVPCSDAAWEELLSSAPSSVAWIRSADALPPGSPRMLEDNIPALFWAGGEGNSRPFVSTDGDGRVIFWADIVALTLFMLTRWEEIVVPARDAHQRFPAAASVACKQSFLERPVVDEYGLILRAWLKQLRPAWQPLPLRFSVKLSHDIDRIRSFRTTASAARTLLGDMVKRRSAHSAWHTVREAFSDSFNPPDSVSYRAIFSLADLSRQHNLESAFYFMADDSGILNADYKLAAPLLKRCIEQLSARGFEIGLHPGYETLNDVERLAREKSQLDAVLGQTEYGGRQHYLRFSVPGTWNDWEKVGLAYDSTLSYADHEGFRCGTCHSFAPFDLQKRCELRLRELPLIVMDATLRDYRHLDPQTGRRQVEMLARRCKQVGGTFTLLWHNSSLQREHSLWTEAYSQVLSFLDQLQAGVETEEG